MLLQKGFHLIVKKPKSNQETSFPPTLSFSSFFYIIMKPNSFWSFIIFLPFITKNFRRFPDHFVLFCSIVSKSCEIVDKSKIAYVTSEKSWLYCVSYFFWVYSIIQRVYPKSPEVGRPYMAFLGLVHFLSWKLQVTQSKKHTLLSLNLNLSLTKKPFSMNEIYVE